jgi:hypothetical protein
MEISLCFPAVAWFSAPNMDDLLELAVLAVHMYDFRMAACGCPYSSARSERFLADTLLVLWRWLDDWHIDVVGRPFLCAAQSRFVERGHDFFFSSLRFRKLLREERFVSLFAETWVADCWRRRTRKQRQACSCRKSGSGDTRFLDCPHRTNWREKDSSHMACSCACALRHLQ